MIPFLNDPARVARDDAFHPVGGIGTLLLRKMESVSLDIDQIKPPTDPTSTTWKGLDRTSELASLDFAFHSILTNLLHLRQIAITQSPVDAYLDSARRGLKALLTLCASGDRQKTVAYLHWTLLYYPLTPSIALFINAIATSHSGDFAILSAVSDCLAQSGALSAPVAAMQRLLRELVGLCRDFFNPGTSIANAGAGAHDNDNEVVGGHGGHGGVVENAGGGFGAVFGDYLVGGGRDEVGFSL